MTEVAITFVPPGLATKALILFGKSTDITGTPDLPWEYNTRFLSRYRDDDNSPVDEERLDSAITKVFYNRNVLQCLMKKLEEKYGASYGISFDADKDVGEYIEFRSITNNRELKTFLLNYPPRYEMTPELKNAISNFYEMYSRDPSAVKPKQQEFEEAKTLLLSSIRLVELDHTKGLPALSSEFMRMLSECSGIPETKTLRKAKGVLRQKQTIETIASEKGLPPDVATELKSYFPIPKAGTRHKKLRKQRKRTIRRRRRTTS